MAKMTLTLMSDDCCASGVCKNGVIAQKTISQSELLQFFRNTKSLYAAEHLVLKFCILQLLKLAKTLVFTSLASIS
jgi:hypothetical protein